jgi:hypothetical protein
MAGPALALLRQEMSVNAVNGDDRADGSGGRKPERLSIMLWRSYEAASEVVRRLKLNLLVPDWESASGSNRI